MAELSLTNPSLDRSFDYSAWIPEPAPASSSKSSSAPQTHNMRKLPRTGLVAEQRPLQIGPWRIKRSQSVPDVLPGRPSYDEQRRPSLANTLATIDEQCAVIKGIVSSDVEDNVKSLSYRGGVPCGEAQIMSSHHEKEHKCYGGGRHFPGDKYIAAALAICCAAIFFTPALLVYHFARKDWGPIVLPSEAPPKIVLAVALGLLCIAVGFVVGVAGSALVALRRGLEHTRRIGCWLVLASSALAIILTSWVLAILLPLVEHGQTTTIDGSG